MMLKNICPNCNYSTPETQDWFCPVCPKENGHYVKLNRNVLVK